MAQYQYIARTAGGKRITGVMQADNEAMVLRTLDERSLYPVRVTEQAAGRRRRSGGARVKGRLVGMFFEQLADLLRAGVPMIRALDTAANAAASEALGAIIRRVRDSVSGGKTLSDALMAHPRVFSTLHTSMIHAGERAGFLEDVLTNLSDLLDKQDDLRGKVRGAMIYPAVLCTLGLFAITFILVWLVPQFQNIFGERMNLPLPTAVLFAFSGALLEWWPVLLGAAGLLVLLTWWFLQSDLGRRLWGRWQLRIPFLGRIIRTVAVARFCRILGTMLGNGVQILQALEISRGAAGSTVLGEAIGQAGESVRQGATLADPLRESGMFPLEIVEMIAVAEESNQLDRVLVKIADTVERRTDRQVDQAVRLVEPLILVVIAGAIGFVAMGLMFPIFSMSEMMQ